MALRTKDKYLPLPRSQTLTGITFLDSNSKPLANHPNVTKVIYSRVGGLKVDFPSDAAHVRYEFKKEDFRCSEKLLGQISELIPVPDYYYPSMTRSLIEALDSVKADPILKAKLLLTTKEAEIFAAVSSYNPRESLSVLRRLAAELKVGLRVQRLRPKA